MRPFLLKGHERSLTFLKYNRDGDLLFSFAKNHNPIVWVAGNGDRLDTYRGHNGAVWCCDVSQIGEFILTIKGPQGRINRGVWGPLNKTIISAGEDTIIRIWDSKIGQLLKESDKKMGHQKTVTSLVKSADGSHFLIGSLDKSAKIVQEEIGGVKGHFGLINALAFNHDGRSFSSGGEDGCIRLHHFDSDYFHIKM